MGVGAASGSQDVMFSKPISLLVFWWCGWTSMAAPPVPQEAPLEGKQAPTTRITDSFDKLFVNEESFDKVVTNSASLDLFLNFPPECDRAYDSIIASLEKCKSGVDRGHPDIKNGCLLHLDLTAPEFQCRSTERQGQKRYENSAIIFPEVGETPWHPTPKCADSNCLDDDEEEPVIWSDSDAKPTHQEVVEYLKQLFKKKSPKY